MTSVAAAAVAGTALPATLYRASTRTLAGLPVQLQLQQVAGGFHTAWAGGAGDVDCTRHSGGQLGEMLGWGASLWTIVRMRMRYKALKEGKPLRQLVAEALRARAVQREGETEGGGDVSEPNELLLPPSLTGGEPPAAL